MTRKLGTTKGAKAKADRYFSLIVRARGRCENCGSVAYLQTAHVFSRRFSATRTDERNAYCLCAGCHHWYTDHPTEWGLFVLSHMGDAQYQALLALAMTPTKVDWQAEAERLKARWEEIEGEDP